MSTTEGKTEVVTRFGKGKSLIEKDTVTRYKNLWSDEDLTDNEKEAIKKRKEQYMWLTNKYYDLATTFYEWGWGQSFHFAPRWKWETRQSGMHRHEYALALKMKVEKGQKIIDLGCGVGGPQRNIARFTEATVIGLNNNESQLKRARELTKLQGMEKYCPYVKADFMHIPFKDNELDGAYQIEATCHAPEKLPLYKEIYRVLKPGAYFAGYEWIVTEKYDNKNPKHRMLKKGVEIGNGVADLEKPSHILACLKDAGFEIVYSKDVGTDYDPQYQTAFWADLDGKWSLEGFRHTKLGFTLTHALCWALERLKIAPEGTTMVSSMLMQTAKDLVESGKLKIFSPSFFVVVRKPLDDNNQGKDEQENENDDEQGNESDDQQENDNDDE